MSQFKSRLDKIEGKMSMKSNYSQIIEKHAIENKKGHGKDKGMLVHSIIALYINSNPEHKSSLQARNYLEWVNGYNSRVIDSAHAAIDDLIAAGLATVKPHEFISDGRDTSRMTHPYPRLCSPEQIGHYTGSSDTCFWSAL